ncbi:integral membrane protein-like protein [Xylogone sp. PMI_703]|nr:integral membrane protein-like protein [Xylogone sp. PMI_703]
MLFEDLLSFCLRVGELAFSTIVAGLTGDYLHRTRHASSYANRYFIYTEVVAAIGILTSLLFLLPFATTFIHWPIDFINFILFMVAFGLLTDWIGPMNCGSVWYWGDIIGDSQCSKWKADIAFAFLASIFFLASCLLGLYVVYHLRRTDRAGAGRYRWYRRNYY